MLRSIALLAACGATIAPAMAADILIPGNGPGLALRGGYLHLGAAYVRQADDATLFAAGTEVPGAAFETEPAITLGLEAGLFLSDGLAVSISGIVPTTTPNTAAGTLAGLGNLGDETVGFYSATAHYHFALNDMLEPYVGGGLGYMHVFGTEDGVVSDMSVESAWGGVLQAGVDVKLADSIGLYADVKRYFISTTASGTLAGAPITAEARVDPWVVSTGISFDF